jgi:hypothetical protein
VESGKSVMEWMGAFGDAQRKGLRDTTWFSKVEYVRQFRHVLLAFPFQKILYVCLPFSDAVFGNRTAKSHKTIPPRQHLETVSERKQLLKMVGVCTRLWKVK